MARRNPPAKWVLPTVINPTEHRCIKIQVPDDPAHIAAFRGALLALASAYNWQDDPSHKAKDVALVWRNILDNSFEWGCDAMPTKLRVDDICTLSWSYDDWVTFDSYDPSGCILANIDSVVPGMINDAIAQAILDGKIAVPSGQPSAGGTIPPSQCRDWHVQLAANSQWHLPLPMNYGDTIVVSNVKGGWTDGTVVWYCPDGSEYYLGACLPVSQHHETSDPLNPGAYHMALIMKVGDTWYPAPLTQFQQASGTNPLDVIFQANDSPLSDNTGTIEFDVHMCTGTLCSNAGYVSWEQFASGVAPHGIQVVTGSGLRMTQNTNINAAVKHNLASGELGPSTGPWKVTITADSNVSLKYFASAPLDYSDVTQFETQPGISFVMNPVSGTSYTLTEPWFELGWQGGGWITDICVEPA
jgi:hypothetical protein